MIEAPILQLPILKTIFIQIDASGTGMGVVLTQNGHLVSFFSKIFCAK